MVFKRWVEGFAGDEGAQRAFFIVCEGFNTSHFRARLFISPQGTPLREGNECVVDTQGFVE